MIPLLTFEYQSGFLLSSAPLFTIIIFWVTQVAPFLHTRLLGIFPIVSQRYSLLQKPPSPGGEDLEVEGPHCANEK